MPFAWIGLEIRARFMSAYGFPTDAEDNRLLGLLIFIHRAWDDLLDSFSPETLYDAVMSEQPPADPRFSLAHRLTKLCNRLAVEKGCYEKLLAAFGRAMAFYRRPFEPSSAASYFAEKAEINAEAHFALLPRLPEDMARSLRPFNLWLFSLDEAADIDSDRARGRTTIMTLAADPVAEILRFHDECVEHVRRTAPRNPAGLFLLMRSMTEEVVAALRKGKDIERDFFGKIEAKGDRPVQPGKPYRPNLGD